MLRAEPRFWRASFRSSIFLARDALGHGALQKLAELAPVLAVLSRRRIHTVLEIGTASGGTIYAWCRVAASDAVIVSVDLPGGEFGGGYPEKDAERILGYAGADQTLHLLRLDSHKSSTRDEIVERLGGRALDFLMIDGDHTYEGVKQDFEWYAPLVKPGGLIAFHDIAQHTHPDCHVDQLWEEIRGAFRTIEFFDPTDVRAWGPWGGIGVLAWTGNGLSRKGSGASCGSTQHPTRNYPELE